jgi:tRNA(Arg) A34 adenosine deaminase TadA
MPPPDDSTASDLAAPDDAPVTDADRAFVRQALDLAVANVADGGGPFGALVVRAGETLATGANRVTPACDPTAHAEVVALRAACQAVGDFRLAGCTLYASCEPCPMCLAAAYWARIDRIVYAATRHAAAAAGFDDAHLYDELARPPADRDLPMAQTCTDEASRPFAAWNAHDARTPY